jgi:hypothetical protein
MANLGADQGADWSLWVCQYFRGCFASAPTRTLLTFGLIPNPRAMGDTPLVIPFLEITKTVQAELGVVGWVMFDDKHLLGRSVTRQLC